jgi:hypothetical protein
MAAVGVRGGCRVAVAATGALAFNNSGNGQWCLTVVMIDDGKAVAR